MRFLLCSFSSPGFLFPLVGVALELRRRGHAVAFVSGLPARPVLEAEGLTRLPRGDRDGDSFEVSVWAEPLRAAIDVKHIEYAIQRHHPDALISHYLCLSALAVRERLGIPTAVMGGFTYLHPHAAPRADVPPSRAERRRQRRFADEAGRLDSVRRLFDLPPAEPSPEDSPLLGDLFMLRTAPRAERGLHLLPRRVHAVGACDWEPDGGVGEGAEGGGELESAFAAPDRPVVYVQNGRTFGGPSFWPRLVEALAPAPLQVVASVGRMDAEVGSLPPNFLARPHVPQGLVLPRARAVVAGGHSSVVIGAAVHGRPSVLIPYGGETPDNAESLAGAGCALSLEMEGLAPAAIRDAVDAVLADTAMGERCRILRDDMRAMGSPGAAAALVEAMARTGAPVLRVASAAESDAEAAGAVPAAA